MVRMPPRIGVTQGDQPAPNETPMMNDDVTVPGVPGSNDSARGRARYGTWISPVW